MPLRPPAYLNRFKQIDFGRGVSKSLPFRFVEIGWSTERPPRQSDTRFSEPHFDIQFHTTGRKQVKKAVEAASGRRFFDRPDECFLPAGSIAVADAVEPQPGLYNLAGEIGYSEEEPIIVYGTYDDDIVFLGVSLTLDVFNLAATDFPGRSNNRPPTNMPGGRTRSLWNIIPTKAFSASRWRTSQNAASANPADSALTR